MTHPTKLAKAIADRCSDAYSSDRYNSWAAVAQTCLDMGYDEREAEAIMRSKYTRWAADSSGAPYGKVPAHALSTMKDRSPSMFSAKEIADLVEGTF